MADLARRVPFVVAGIAAVAALVLARTGPPTPSPPSLTPSAPPSARTAAPSAATAAPSPPPRYEPDLRGDDVGEAVVSMAETVSSLAVGSSLVWLTTSPVRLHTARLDGGEVTTAWTATEDDAFGGELTLREEALAWSVEGTGSLERMIHVAPLASVDAHQPLLRSGSPEHLRWTGTHLIWAERGSIVTAPRDGPQLDEPVVRLRRDGRIAGLVAHAADLFFLEEPLAGRGARGLFRLRDDVVTRVASVGAEAADLEVVGTHLVWTEADGDGYQWRRQSLDGGRAGVLARCGLVTARAVDGDRLVWAERHGDEPVVTLLRAAHPGDASSVSRLGRDTGLVTALAVAPGGVVYWASEDGIQRLMP